MCDSSHPTSRWRSCPHACVSAPYHRGLAGSVQHGVKTEGGVAVPNRHRGLQPDLMCKRRVRGRPSRWWHGQRQRHGMRRTSREGPFKCVTHGAIGQRARRGDQGEVDQILHAGGWPASRSLLPAVGVYRLGHMIGEWDRWRRDGIEDGRPLHDISEAVPVLVSTPGGSDITGRTGAGALT